MFDFLRRRRLLRRGLASKKTRRRRTRNELLRSLESASYVKVFILAAFIAGLAFLIFSGQQPEPTKNFVVALLFFAGAIMDFTPPSSSVCGAAFYSAGSMRRFSSLV